MSIQAAPKPSRHRSKTLSPQVRHLTFHLIFHGSLLSLQGSQPTTRPQPRPPSLSSVSNKMLVCVCMYIFVFYAGARINAVSSNIEQQLLIFFIIIYSIIIITSIKIIS